MIKADFTETGDVEMPPSGWEEHERIRLQRLKEQRQRMENMKQVVEQYSRIISDLQAKNRILQTENQQLKMLLQRKEISLAQGENLAQKYGKVREQLERQREQKQNYEITIDSLKKQLITNEKRREYQSINLNAKLRSEMQSDYEILEGLYEQLKNEMYYLQKQNITLRDTIREQSKNYYDRDLLYYGSGATKNCSHTNSIIDPIKYQNAGCGYCQQLQSGGDKTLKYSLSEKESKIQKSNIANISQPMSTKKSIIKNQSGYENQIEKLLREQIRKQDELINKFKINEEKQLDLIQLLKKQKSKLCLCHKYGKSGKKNGNRKEDIPTFKNYEERA